MLPLHDPVAVFAVVLFVLLAAPLVGRRGVPPSVVLLGFGIVLGPHALGVLDRDPTMVLLGTVGLLYLVFLAGLEVDLHEFAAQRRLSLTFGVLTFVIPQTVGVAVARTVLGMGWPTAILLGSVFASHTLLAYPVVGRLGLQKARAATASVGATILTDTFALLVLAVVASGARGAGGPVETVLRVAVPLLLFAGAVLWALPRLGAWFLKTAASEAALEFVFVLAAVFACAWGVRALGVEPIIGAFLAGLALNRLVPEGGPLMARVTFVGNALFIPFFLLSTGMLVDLGAFAGGPGVGRSWLVAVTMVGTVLATKGTAAYLTRPAFGFSRAEAALAFGLTIPQAAATLAAVLVGVEVGLFDAAVLNGAIAMVFVTCIVGPSVAEAAGRRLAAVQARRTGSAPRRLLLSLANPETSEALVDLALLARPAGEPVSAVTLVAPGPDQEEGVARGENVLAVALARAVAADAALVPLVRIEPNVARGLARAVVEARASALVLGWDGSAAAERALFGTVPDRVLRETPAAVVVARAVGAWSAVRRLVIAVPPRAALAPGFAAAAETLARVAGRLGAPVVLVTPDEAMAAAQAPFERAAVVPLADWAGALDALDATLRPGDAVALVSARAGSVGWQAGLDRLPRALAERFAERPLVVVYPGRSAAEPARARAAAGTSRRLAAASVVLDVPGRTVADVVGVLAPDAALAEALLEAPVELRPGVVLAHGRTAALARTVLRVGVSRRGVSMDGLGAVRVVVALGLPADAAPAEALGWLAALAHALGQDATVEALLSAPDEAAARAALAEAR